MSADHNARGLALAAKAAAVFAPTFYNRRANNGDPLPYWRSARARVRAGAGRAKILCMGDSTTTGYGSTGTGVDATALNKLKSYPYRLAERLTALGLSAHGDSVVGVNNSFNQYPSADTRLVLGAGWGQSGSNLTLGGQPWLNSTTTNAWAFSPTYAFDTIVVKYLQFSGGGTFTVDIGGAALATINCNGANAYGSQTISTAQAAAAGTINVKRVSGTIYFYMVEAYDSATHKVSVLNGGWSSATTTMTANVTGAWNSLNAAVANAPDISIIMQGINSWSAAAESVALYTTNSQATITALKAVGDVLLVTPFPSDPSVATVAVQQGYNEAARNLAKSNDIPLLDMWQLSGGGVWATANARGLAYDTKHGTATFYAALADAVAAILMQ